MTSAALEQRLLAFALDEKADDFGDLALALFEHQYVSLPLYRRRCEALGVAPATVSNWREIPAAIAGEPGTAVSAGFQPALVRAGLPDLAGPRVALAIEVESDTDAGTNVNAAANAVVGVLADSASEQSLVSRGRLAAKPLRSWLAARQRSRLAVQVISTKAGLESLTDLLERRGLKFRLPPASTAFCVTPAEEASESSWNSSLGESLGIPPQAYRRVICRPQSTPLLEASEEVSVFRLPHWVRVTSDSESPAILDLASINAPAHRIEPVARGAGDASRLILA